MGQEKTAEFLFFGDYEKLLLLADLTKYIEFGSDFPDNELRIAIQANPELSQKYLYSDNGKTLLNLDKLNNRDIYRKTLTINYRDLERIAVSTITNGNNNICILADGYGEISEQYVKELIEKGYPIISICANRKTAKNYIATDLQTYFNVQKELREISEITQISISELQKILHLEFYQADLAQINLYNPNDVSIDTLRKIKNSKLEIKTVNFRDSNGTCRPRCDSEEYFNGDYEKLIEILDFVKEIKIGFPQENLRKFLEEHPEFNEKYLLSDDGESLINIEKIGNRELTTSDININIRDLPKISLDELCKGDNKITIVINNASELSCEKIEELKEKGYPIAGIKMFSKEKEIVSSENYDIETYYAIRKKLDELVEGIDINLPEKEKFAEVYKRLCKSIRYDDVVAYPQNEKEKEISNQESSNARNLKNGLLEGKCVCSGYADILKNALSIVGIEAQYISGKVFDHKEKLKKFDEEKHKGYGIVKDEEKGIVTVLEGHAWNKVKLDGIWYNVDPTWDCSNIRNGKNPIYCLKTDEEIRKIDKKTDFQGPECNTVVAKKEIDKMFDGKHLFIGNIMIPTAKDMVNSLKQVIEDISDSGRRAYRKAIGMREKILRLFTQKKVESLPHPVENKNSEENKSRPSWDLENWNDFKYTHSIQSDKVQKNGDNLRETIGREDEL